jgi:DNA-binding transcriptional MocR family regulator
MVFEELLVVSDGPVDACRATVSIRSLASRLGLAKDTVARAIGLLRRAGLVTAQQSRADTGVFATGSYTIQIPSSITVDDHTPTPSPAATTPTSSTSCVTGQPRSTHTPVTQLSLPLP